MRDLGQKRTIHIKGYRWGFARSKKQDKEQLSKHKQKGRNVGPGKSTLEVFCS